jgi:hypothetical protein
MHPGDKVLPADLLAGALQAMLIVQATPATRYLTNFYLQAFISKAYIQQLRKSYFDDLALAKPRFIIRVSSAMYPWIEGFDTTHEFPEFDAILKEDYTVGYQEDAFQIYELKTSTD